MNSSRFRRRLEVSLPHKQEPRRGRLPWLSAFLAVALLAGRPAIGDARSPQSWTRLYTQAEEHISKREWREAESKLSEAKRLRPQQGRQVVFSGIDRRLYAPDFLLGIVYLNTGRPEEALAMFEAVRRAGLIRPGDRDYAALERHVTTARVAKPPATTVAAVSEAARAEAGPDSPLTDTSAPPPSFEAPSMPVSRVPMVLAGGGNLTAPGPGPPRSGSTTSLLAPTASPAATTTAAPSVATTAPASEPPARLNEQLAQAQLATERGGAVAFFRGDYRDALTALESAAPSPRTRFYRACSLAALALMAGNANGDALNEARREYGLALASGTSLAADRRYVSPRLLRLLASEED